jgi:hypothetical protein
MLATDFDPEKFEDPLSLPDLINAKRAAKR